MKEFEILTHVIINYNDWPDDFNINEFAGCDSKIRILLSDDLSEQSRDICSFEIHQIFSESH